MARMAPKAPDARKLSDLLEISRILASTLNLRAALTRVLEVLEKEHGAAFGAVSLVDAQTDELVVEAATGVSWAAARRRALPARRGHHRPRLRERPADRGASGQQRAAVPEPAGRVPSESAREMTFVAVPITVDSKTVGALGVGHRYQRERHYDQEAKFLGVVASMVGQAVRVHGLVESERQRLVEENTKLRQELRERHAIHNIVGNSRPMQDVYDQIAQVAAASTTVLIRGESGTGKEMIAHAIHYNSPRAEKPFVKVSCAALPESLIESELFGYEKGAFTDARTQKKGRFERAHGGTLFLDEIGELSPSTQVKLLRVLQEREFERLGGTQP